MGGRGSGSHDHWWRPAKKLTVEDCLSLDAARCARQGILRAGSWAGGSWTWTYASGTTFRVHYWADTRDPNTPLLRVWYSWTWGGQGQPQSADYPLGLTTTRPRFGGLRWWFLCPLVTDGKGCGRRVGKLYLPPEGRYFGCRHCYRLTYTSCQESHRFDAALNHLARESGLGPEAAKGLLRRLRDR